MQRDISNWTFAAIIVPAAIIMSIAGTGVLRLSTLLKQGNLADWAIVLLIVVVPLLLSICWWNEVTYRKTLSMAFNSEIDRLEIELSKARTEARLLRTASLQGHSIDDIHSKLRRHWNEP